MPREVAEEVTSMAMAEFPILMEMEATVDRALGKTTTAPTTVPLKVSYR